MKLDAYELKLLRRLKSDLATQAKKKRRAAPTMVGIIRACIRTAIHTVYGDGYAASFLTEEEFKSKMQHLLKEVDDEADE